MVLGQGGNPFGLLQPHGSDGRGVLEPTNPRFHSGLWVLRGRKNLGIRPLLRAPWGGEYRPPRVVLWVTPHRGFNHHALARLGRRSGGLRGPSSTGTTCAARLCDDAIADRVSAPGTRPAPALS